MRLALPPTGNPGSATANVDQIDLAQLALHDITNITFVSLKTNSPGEHL